MYKKTPPPNFFFLPDGILYSLVPIALGAILFFVIGLFSLIFLLPAAFILFFFRNPRRKREADTKALLSPADGKILSAKNIGYDDFIGQEAVNISIFLSLFNAHINRSPIDGKVISQKYKEGAMLPAFKSHASELNERNTVYIETDTGQRVIVRQITGFIARRIVWWVKEDDRLKQGEKFGYIKFGSRTELVVPADTEILVTEGDKVKAGSTIMGILK